MNPPVPGSIYEKEEVVKLKKNAHVNSKNFIKFNWYQKILAVSNKILKRIIIVLETI